MKLDLHNNSRARRIISPVAMTTTAGTLGKPVDTKGYNGVEIIISYGTITATNATLTPIIYEGDVTGTMTSVADADLIGTEALAGITATTPRTSAVSKNVTKRIGYKGNKRYITAKITSTITAATIISVDALLHTPDVGPAPNP